MPSYLSPKARKQKSRHGFGLFAIEHISKGETVVDYTDGTGQILSTEEANELYEEGNDYMLQVDDNRFFVATNGKELEDADFLNHSCDANLGVEGSLRFVALRDVEPGEEVAFDYAMTESSDWVMECWCGAVLCRRTITGDDWKQPDLQARYSGHFSDYLERQISSQ